MAYPEDSKEMETDLQESISREIGSLRGTRVNNHPLSWDSAMALTMVPVTPAMINNGPVRLAFESPELYTSAPNFSLKPASSTPPSWCTAWVQNSHDGMQLLPTKALQAKLHQVCEAAMLRCV